MQLILGKLHQISPLFRKVTLRQNNTSLEYKREKLNDIINSYTNANTVLKGCLYLKYILFILIL